MRIAEAADGKLIVDTAESSLVCNLTTLKTSKDEGAHRLFEASGFWMELYFPKEMVGHINPRTAAELISNQLSSRPNQHVMISRVGHGCWERLQVHDLAHVGFLWRRRRVLREQTSDCSLVADHASVRQPVQGPSDEAAVSPPSRRQGPQSLSLWVARQPLVERIGWRFVRRQSQASYVPSRPCPLSQGLQKRTRTSCSLDSRGRA
ncbi:hypothetical protein AB1Y20_005049 [Prymnesium parvum]|uniref:Uncharacterized protein n=1 Tax=Prymnesium parvum TaxID=97485 RepID=A0AB34J554_PRYPA